MADERVRTSLKREKTSWRIISLGDGGDVISIKNASVRELLASGTQPIGFAFLDDAERLSPHLGSHCMRTDPRASFARLGPLQGRMKKELATASSAPPQRRRDVRQDRLERI